MPIEPLGFAVVKTLLLGYRRPGCPSNYTIDWSTSASTHKHHDVVVCRFAVVIGAPSLI
jgi:hypothetical protein